MKTSSLLLNSLTGSRCCTWLYHTCFSFTCCRCRRHDGLFSTLLWKEWCLSEFLLQKIILNLLKPLSTFYRMISLPGRALSTAVRRSMSINHSLRDVHVSSNNLCRFPWCGFPGCEPIVLKHLCIPTEFNWHPSHCSDLRNPSLKVYHQVRIIDFTLAYPDASGKSCFPLAATRSHSCRKLVPQLLTHLSDFTAVLASKNELA